MLNSHLKYGLKTAERKRGAQQQVTLLPAGGNTTMGLILNPHTSDEYQPNTKPISHQELVANVVHIYRRLYALETQCIETHETCRNLNVEVTHSEWKVYTARQLELLEKHYEFLTLTYHPIANTTVRRLPAKYLMAGRLWKHGIHSFLEILRARQPGSHEHMLTFIHQAYALLELLYESVPTLEDIWLNFLGDVSRYGMFVDENSDDGNIWIGVSRQWYSLASEKSPSAGHLYHHLAILARGDAIQKLYLYAKSLCVALPFTETRKNIWTLFYPGPCERRLSWIDAAFICVHRILFSKKAEDLFYQASKDYLALLDLYISTATKKWRTIGYQTAIALCCSLLDYGEESNFFINQIAPRQKQDISDSASTSTSSPNELFPKARDFAIDVYQLVANRVGDPNTLSFLHTFLVFVWRLSKLPAAIVHLEKKFPWETTADMLNSILDSCGFEARMDSEEFPGALKNDTPRPLPEDFALRSLVFADKYFPSAWFENCKLEEQIELASMDGQRRERLLWLGCRIASTKQWLIWNNRQFTVQRGYI